MNLLPRPIASSLGKKYVMAVTGVLLIGFVLTHMAGNLLIYAGPDALNTYAAKLKDLGALLWVARAGLLLIFLVHLYLGIALTLENRAARPMRYRYEDTLQASWASRNMFLTGMLLLAFIVYHLAHFTFGVVHQATVELSDGKTVQRNYLELAETSDPNRDLTYSELKKDDKKARHDVYRMVIAGFSNPFIAASYIVAMIFLGLHLWHGGSSWLQTLGLNGTRWRPLVSLIGPVLAMVIMAGNCSIPLSVWLGVVR